METIASFTVDHNKLLRGVYVSRVDPVGEDYVTTFDIRMKEPNREPVVDVPALHTIEHLGATFLRNHPQGQKDLIYFGPMGCRTGCYALFKGKKTSQEILPLIKELFSYMAGYQDKVPGTEAVECGNYLSHDLAMAQWESQKFLTEILEKAGPENLNYPE